MYVVYHVKIILQYIRFCWQTVNYKLARDIRITGYVFDHIFCLKNMVYELLVDYVMIMWSGVDHVIFYNTHICVRSIVAVQ